MERVIASCGQDNISASPIGASCTVRVLTSVDAGIRLKPFPTCSATVVFFRPLNSCDTTHSRLPGEVRVNKRVQGVGGDLATLRLDIVVTHEPSRTVVIVDVTVPFKNTFAELEGRG